MKKSISRKEHKVRKEDFGLCQLLEWERFRGFVVHEENESHGP